GYDDGGARSLYGLEQGARHVPLKQGMAEIEHESRAADAIGTVIVCPLEASEDACLLPRGNTDPAITDAEMCRLCLNRLAQPHLDGATLWAVLDGIAEQIPQDLLNTLRVYLGNEVLPCRLERERVLCRCPLEAGHHPPAQGHQVRQFTREFQ